MERHSRLFASNVVPEPAEVIAVRGDIDARIKTIHQLDLELQGLDAELGRIEVERRRVEEQRRTLQEEPSKVAAERATLGSLLTPLRRFPVEMSLSKIFVAVNDDCEVFHEASQVINVCRVCRLWRDAAIGTPQLWSQLKLSGFTPSKCDINKISSWFARSGTVARYLELRDLICHTSHGGGADGCQLVDSSRLVQLLTHGPPLHTLFLRSIKPTCFQNLAKAMKDVQLEGSVTRPWDSLKYLRILVSYHQQTPPLSNLLDDLPSVTSFRLSGWWDGAEPHVQRYPTANDTLHNLTTFTIQDFTLPSALKILAVCSNIQELTMVNALHDTLEINDRQPILLQQLRVLRLNHWPCGQIIAFLQVLRTPRLADFRAMLSSDKDEEADHVSSHDSGNEEDMSASSEGPEGDRPSTGYGPNLIGGLISFFRNSEATIHILRIGNFSFGSGALEGLLFGLPSVTHLALEDISGDCSPFRTAHELPSDTHSHLLLQLESLRLTEILDPIHFENVCDFFVHRATHPQSGIKRIETLRLEMRFRSLRKFNANALRRAVTKLRKLGVDVYVSFYR